MRDYLIYKYTVLFKSIFSFSKEMNAKAVSFLMDEYCKSQDLSERVFLPEILNVILLLI